MIHELDSLAACLYCIDKRQLVRVFETFFERWDFADRLEGVLLHFRAWGQR